MTAVTKVDIPSQSIVQDRLHDADFYDAYEVLNAKPERTALQVWVDALQKSPPWVRQALRLRNAIVSKFGLKVGEPDELKPANEYKVGERVGIFTLQSISDVEVLMGQPDKHLDFLISVCKTTNDRVVISTVVHIHNWFGHAYMFFVKPMHRIIAPLMLSKI
jgi:hypothetical protein